MKPGDMDEDGRPLQLEDQHGPIGGANIQSNRERELDAVQRLREVVAEVTRGRIPAPEKRGPRF